MSQRMHEALVVLRPEGLYCPAGDFYIDPWRSVDKAVITHAHADHARTGSEHYLSADSGRQVLQTRLGAVSLQTLPYRESVNINGVNVSFYPAGHVLGSAQVRIEHKGQVWVASGDYKVEHDLTCEGFEPVKCHTFITESTFGLPIYHWRSQQQVFNDINRWWSNNAANGKTSVLFCYSFGKAQRILSGLDASIGPIICHGAVEALNRAYRDSGVNLPDTLMVSDTITKGSATKHNPYANAIVIAPPSTQGTPWIRRFGDYVDAFASGWMQVRGARRRRSVDQGFVLSDHADWNGLQQAIKGTGAEHVIVTHGYVPVLVRWLNDHGLQASSFKTEYAGEEGAAV